MYDDNEVLVDVVHQVFEVGIHRGLGVNSRLLVRQHVVKLDDAYRNHLVLLSADQCVSKYRIFHYFLDDHSNEVIAFSNVPPIIAELGCVLVVPQTLNS